MGQLVAQAEGELERIAARMQTDFVAFLDGERFGAEEGLGALVERRGFLQADGETGRFVGRTDVLQRGVHRDRQRRADLFRDGVLGGGDFADDLAAGKNEWFGRAAGRREEARQKQCQRGGPDGATHGRTIPAWRRGYNKIAVDKDPGAGVEHRMLIAGVIQR